MNKTFTTLAIMLSVTACTQTGVSQSGGMMQDDMMKHCQEMMSKSMAKGEMMPCCQKMMKDGMMKGGMSADMMKQCQMMQQGKADQRAPAAPSGVSPEEHKQHHPAQ